MDFLSYGLIERIFNPLHDISVYNVNLRSKRYVLEWYILCPRPEHACFGHMRTTFCPQ